MNIFSLVLKDLCIYLKFRVTQREKERQRERESELLSAGSLLSWPQWLELRQSKARSQELLLVSHVGAGAQALGLSSTAFPGHSRELDRKWSSQVSNQYLNGLLAFQARALTCCATAPVPFLHN